MCPRRTSGKSGTESESSPALVPIGTGKRGSHEIGMESTPHDVGGAGPILRLLQLLQLKRLQRCWSARSIHCRVVCQCKATPVSVPGPSVPPAKAAQRLSSWPNTSPFCFIPAARWIDIYLSRHREGSLLGKTIVGSLSCLSAGYNCEHKEDKGGSIHCVSSRDPPLLNRVDPPVCIGDNSIRM